MLALSMLMEGTHYLIFQNKKVIKYYAIFQGYTDISL